MREENPAITLYNTWRSIIRWRGERNVDQMRRQHHAMLRSKENPTGLSDWELEEHILKNWYRASHRLTPVNYRLSLEVRGLSAQHLADDRLFDDLDDWEPIISLNVRCRRTPVGLSLMTLWPNGDFMLERRPAQFHQIFPEFTFLRTSYVGGRRVWLVHSSKMDGYKGWVQLNETDYNNPVPYLPNHSFHEDGQYKIVPAENGHWKIQALIGMDEKKSLADGYAAAEARYARHRRKHEVIAEQERTRNMVAMYVPRHGLLTNEEAVARFSQYMQVYEPATRP